MAVGFPTKVDYATGDVLSAGNMNDLSGTVNLLESAAESAAGVNKIINGDFAINQRAFTSTTTDNAYGFDRWQLKLSGATATYSAQTFTPGAAPVAGYEAANFARLAVTVGNDGARLNQLIEDVRTFAGQTATLSFWAKGTNPTTAGNLAVKFVQSFGTGGSPSAQVQGTQQTFVLTANWTRYSFTFAIPSITGKTIGTTPNTSYLALFIEQGSSISTDPWTLDLWGVQFEAGSTASDFKTATGTIQGELAACQRYYQRFATSAYQRFGVGAGQSSTVAVLQIPTKVSFRVSPTAIEYSTLGVIDGAGSITGSAVPTSDALSPDFLQILMTVASGLTQHRPYFGLNNNSATGYIAFTAELN
jgi:hypothetical protein